MYRLDRQMLEVEIGVRVWRAFSRHGNALRSKMLRSQAEAAIVAELVDLFDNPGTCVVVAESSTAPGTKIGRKRFGIDEPWPAPLEAELNAAVRRP